MEADESCEMSGIAELTGRNANVLYELGLAHALGKPFVIITNSMDDVPFDLKDLRCIVYDKDHPKWGESLTKSVTRTMKSVLEEVREHGPLFPKIEADTEYTTVEEETQEYTESARREEEETSDIAGTWELHQKWDVSDDSKTVMYLQQIGHSISGYVLSYPFPIDEEPRWMVSQQVSGFIRGNEFELAATSYQILKSGDETFSWNLDNWRGTIESQNFMRGDLFAEKGDEGTFWGERIEENPQEETPKNEQN